MEEAYCVFTLQFGNKFKVDFGSNEFGLLYYVSQFEKEEKGLVQDLQEREFNC